ncbi:SIS domain-containing protein [Anaerocolumna sp. MB42-C2]|uniref:SIS domain-containing protein n=1 Tax=Anaerocolumna sp. MB42-C2 TaxID=3070997 RepID=UPI0027DF4520|nr:SIS domain-containing protein [Anaerocolumna sp. MB42-C2]WMJ89140.1 SIS domain-containing protein [Anaerocolumna sp. MB42-C2]
MKKEHIELIKAAANAVKQKGKINHIYYVACGGSKATLMPAQYVMDCECDVPSSVYTSNEFVYRVPKALSEKSIVITCSFSGTTPETVEATKLSRSKGALTISLTYDTDSPLWKEAECPLHHDDKPGSDDNFAVLHAMNYNILNTLQPSEKYEKAIKAIDCLDNLVQLNIEKYKNSAIEFGRTHKREEVIYTMGSGGCYPTVYSFTICLMMEMQWIHSNSIHSGEYFHGPFEITDYDVPFLIVKSSGRTRYLDERAHAFCKKFSDKITLVDTDDFIMTGIDEEVREFITPIICMTVLRQYANALSEFRGHPMSVRRYMWKMEY